MSQLFSRVFLQILDSSIAEDFTTRHVFEDLLKLCDHRTGVVDMTRQALSRRLNVPIETLNQSLEKLEAPDASSRDKEHDGRRIERLDDHRDWGWRILNFEKYDAIRTKADQAVRVARHRSTSGVDPALLERAEKIYQAYPRKVAKPDAIKSIIRALEKLPFEELLTKTVAFAATRAGEDEAYTPYPSTWFNQERFNDAAPQSSALPAEGGQDAIKIIEYISKKTGKSFRPVPGVVKMINGALALPGVNLEGCLKMIDRQCMRWQGTELDDYLRPETLFRSTNFNSYYASKDQPVKQRSEQRVDRSIGTTNEGSADMFAGLGDVVGH